MLKKLQNLPLKYKIDLTKSIIQKEMAGKKAAIMYSGGRDSSILSNIVGDKILHIYSHTNMAEIPENIKSKKNIIICENPQNYNEIWDEKRCYPLLSKRGHTAYKSRNPELKISPVMCCYNLKEKPANKVLKDNNITIAIWGNRAGESHRRKFHFVDNSFITKPKKYKWANMYPLQHWTDNDVIEYLTINNIKVKLSKLEHGCKYCATDITKNPNNFIKLYRQNKNELINILKNGFGEQIAIVKGIKYNNSGELNKIIENKTELFIKI